MPKLLGWRLWLSSACGLVFGQSADLSGLVEDPTDHSAGHRIRLFAPFNHAPSAQGMRNFTELDDVTAKIDTATVGVTAIVGPAKVNDFRANWSRATGKADSVMQSLFGGTAPPESALFPPFASPENAQAVFSTFTDGEVREGILANNTQHQVNLLDSFSIVAGGHQLKFGMDLRRMEPANAPLYCSYYAVLNDYATLLAVCDSVR